MKRARGLASIPLIVLMLAVAGYLGHGYLRADARLGALELRADEAEIALRHKRELNADLKRRVAELQTDEYIEKVAREKLGLIKPGEIPYLTEPDSGRN